MAVFDLDETDKAIIRELQADGRIAYTKLAPLVGLSQAATRQRVNRLLERGIMQVVDSNQALPGGNADFPGGIRGTVYLFKTNRQSDYSRYRLSELTCWELSCGQGATT